MDTGDYPKLSWGPADDKQLTGAIMTTKPLNLGAIIFPGFEMLDLFGPLEMFSLLGPEKVRIHMVAERKGPVITAMGTDIENGPKVLAEYDFSDAPPLDMILLPGGFGTIPELENESMLSFLAERAKQAQITASVCTGSALLAKAGVLDGHRATSNKQIFALAVAQSDKVEWIEQARWVDDGPVVTSSGVSAGMDMTLAIIQRLFGEEEALTAMASAEYSWQRDADVDPFHSELNKLSGLVGLG
jgi:transcriptional regulator GlxA family with amidase domain